MTTLGIRKLAALSIGFVFLLIFLFLHTSKVNASSYGGVIVGSAPTNTTACSDPSVCPHPPNSFCNNGPGPGNSGGCGTACYDSQNGAFGNAWTKYQYSNCVETSPANPLTGKDQTCGQYAQTVTAVCSTADKYNDRYSTSNPPGDLTMLRYGDCSCVAQSLYKTCCNGSTPVSTYNFTTATGQGNPTFPDGACSTAYTTVRCGDNGISCGQAACLSAFPTPVPGGGCKDICGNSNCVTCPNGSAICNTRDINQCSNPTPTLTPTPTQTPTPTCAYGSCVYGGQVQCSSTSQYQICTFNSQVGGYCWGASNSCNGGQTCVNGSCQTSHCPPSQTYCGGICWDNTICPYGFTNCTGAAQCSPPPTGPPPSPPGPPPTGPTTITPTTPPSPPPPPICIINVNPIYKCVTPAEMEASYAPYANGPTCNYAYWTFINTCLNPPVRYIQPKLSSECVGIKYGCPPGTVTGFVFLDYNNNGIRDFGEPPIGSAINISAAYTPGPYKPAYCQGKNKDWCSKQCACGYYGCSPNCQDSYCEACNLPNDPSYVDPSTCTTTCITEDICWTSCPTPTPAPTTQPLVSYPGSGTYRVSSPTGGDLLPGTYNINYSLPAGFSSSEPPGSTSPSFSVIVGPGCSVDGSRNASCSGGSVLNLDFGVTVVNPWLQSIGNDMRVDAGFQNAVPANASCGSYSSLAGSGGTTGVIYSGGSSPSFGNGQASTSNWTVGNPVNPETFSPTRPNLIRTSYSYLSSVAQAATITPIDIANSCGSGGIANCNLSTSLSNGLYIANGNLTLTGSGYSFPVNKNFVILVHGDLTIKEKIYVPNGSTATFSSSGNITVDRSVGETSLSSKASDVEGFYSADKSFIVDGANNCNVGPDLRLNVAGTVIVNASLGGGTLQNNRSLCSGNNQCPAFSVIERPDFVLNAPEFIKHPSYVWQENAP